MTPDFVIFCRDAKRILKWEPPSRYIALPTIQRMRMRQPVKKYLTFSDWYVVGWLLIPDFLVGLFIAVFNVGPICGPYKWRWNCWK